MQDCSIKDLMRI